VGLANVQYLRHGRFFILIATPGEHPFFAAEAARLRDVREYPVQFHGYSIGCRLGRDGRRYHASVRISREAYRALKAQFEHAARHAALRRPRWRSHFPRRSISNPMPSPSSTTTSPCATATNCAS
jgi:hypothetical protein